MRRYLHQLSGNKGIAFILIALIAVVLVVFIIFFNRNIRPSINEEIPIANYFSSYPLLASKSNLIILDCNLVINLSDIYQSITPLLYSYNLTNRTLLNKTIKLTRAIIGFTECKLFNTFCYGIPNYNLSAIVEWAKHFYSSNVFAQIFTSSNYNYTYYFEKIRNISITDLEREVNLSYVSGKINASEIPSNIWYFYFLRDLLDIYELGSGKIDNYTFFRNFYPTPIIYKYPYMFSGLNSSVYIYFNYYTMPYLPFAPIYVYPIDYCGNYEINVISNTSIFTKLYPGAVPGLKVINVSS